MQTQRNLWWIAFPYYLLAKFSSSPPALKDPEQHIPDSDCAFSKIIIQNSQRPSTYNRICELNAYMDRTAR